MNIKQRILSQQLYLNIRHVNIFITCLEYYVIDILLSDLNESLCVEFFFNFSILKNTLIITISSVIKKIRKYFSRWMTIYKIARKILRERSNIVATHVSKYTLDRLSYTA